ncbi:DUF6503 family protein [Algibacter sp. L4_22]|uniref:DUF6503 family protein n=1 Tax=Algibacter sp. L4_22 TaxID=2942477 RepID=UPI00201B896E|nr:DUF6503 family protein [Algibacter sp. L4_22]MCL5128589.1 hypothetical protein [Algibacter sp. L4_22]
MRNILFLFITISILSCKNETKNETVKSPEPSVEKQVENKKHYPETLVKIFDAHGGLDTWNSMNSLTFAQVKEGGNDVTTTNLKNRKILVDMPKYAIGSNGKDIWLKNKGEEAYKGKPKFFYNLMFYFYSMPFILADDGIIYGDADPLVFEGKTYPGIKISYEYGVGESSGDEYVLYYNPETYKMEWLAYTVTYFSKEKSKDLHFRRYQNWQDVSGLQLPATMAGYATENNVPTKMSREDTFVNVKLSKEIPDATLFDVPEGATIAK